MALAVRESVLAEVWKRQLIRRGDLETVGGQTVRVLYPGRQSTDSGPDFCDAAIALDGDRVVRGDIELHVRSQDWRAHGHHRDANYDSVILHVVLWDGGQEVSPLSNGEKVPILAVSPYLTCRLEEVEQARGLSPPESPCRATVRRRGQAWTSRVLAEAGQERFRLKAGRFARRLARVGPQQALYEGWMRALGYAKNKRPFEKLACLVPLSRIDDYRGHEGISWIQAILLGTGGLLPSQRGRGGEGRCLPAAGQRETDRLERLWRCWELSPAMAVAEWTLFRVRPENHPVRRAVAASHLVSRYGNDMLGEMSHLVAEWPDHEVHRRLEQSMTVDGDGYWGGHFDFGAETRGRPSLVGSGRSRDIVVNVLLPFLWCWGQQTGEPWLAEQARQVYLRHPRLAENWVTRCMGLQLFDEQPKLPSACAQQGLIHLYETCCVEKRCWDCPLGQDGTPGHSEAPGAGQLLDAEITEEVE
ncbi:MAG: hypothetical protein DRI40_02150 [Chloroflexi bacterium]|nr:MAG: hypothetical protein DRI40_02150 [Chloroflexota bacterium]